MAGTAALPKQLGSDGRLLAIKPVLFTRQREPRFRHSAVAFVGCLVLGVFRKTQAVFRILSEDV